MQSQAPDYYALLGVHREATQQEIRQAYLDAAQRLHPDKNKAAGETELFLEVQQAYEILSSGERRAAYDAALPPEDTEKHPIYCDVLYSRPNFVKLSEPQLIYVLLKIGSYQNADKNTSSPLNVCLVIDRSTSMQGAKMNIVKSTAVEIVNALRPEDIFSIVSFSDRAEVIVPASYQLDRQRVPGLIQALQPSGATEMLQGMNAGVNEVRRHLEPGRVNHIVILTDGHTYGDEAECLALAKEVSSEGIGISGTGIGDDWNDVFLDELASQTGGSSAYVSNPQDIQHLLIEKFKSLKQVFAEDVVLNYDTPPGADLQYAFRIQPDPGSLLLDSSLHLGPILQKGVLKVLLEYRIQSAAIRGKELDFLKGSLKVSIISHPIPPTINLRLTRPISKDPGGEPPPSEIIQALSRLSLYRLQEKARQEAEAGEYQKASRHLQLLASKLVDQGERQLARTALIEAEQLQNTHMLTLEGQKTIKYGTRALVIPNDDQEEDVV
ncbi:MAG: VWA domain-containing protein [Anaerolineales bacterium]|nr:VWA domain-containing protein [Anaerolineales bacterium]